MSSEKEPSPEVVQFTEVKLVAVPKISIGSSSQDSISGPASTTTKSIKFKTKESAIASVQGASASAVRVSITFPLLKSRLPGV